MTDQNDDWLTIREASLAIGVSELTIRRRIKDGKIAHRMVGGKYYVNRSLPPLAASVPDDSGGTGRTRTEPLSLRPDATSGHGTNDHGENGPSLPSEVPFQAVLADYGRLAERAGRATLLAERLDELSRECETLRASVLALTGRNGWLESKLEERESQMKLLSDRATKPRLWRRLFRFSEPGASK
jgi:excisionase family DNA binding protein